MTDVLLPSSRERGLEHVSAIHDDDLRLLLLIRHFELALLDLFSAGQLNGTTHTCLGQEHVPVALRPLLRTGDAVFSNHRGHGHYLARFADPAGLLAEIMGRDGAVCAGVGGSQHILRDGYLSTGVQGESVPVAVGVALDLRRNRPGDLALAHIGDGTWGQGAVYEALNMAQLWRVPLVVAVEHNGIAQSTLTEWNLAGSIAGRAAAFGIDHRRVDAIDLNLIRDELEPSLADVRHGAGPLVIEFVVPRVGPHSKGDDTREPEVVDEARGRDWYHHYRRAFPQPFDRLDAEQRRYVETVVADVSQRPPSRWPRP